jgi:precorrin-2 methylase
MREVLVIANRTLGGENLLEAVRERAAREETVFRLVVPMTKPAAGLVIYDEAVRESAQVRVDLAMSLLAQEGIVATGEVGDPDPFSAAMDAIAHRRPDEVIVSTHPVTQSGWLRRDLIERIRNASGLPVEHIVVDLTHEGLPFGVTLVVAHRTSTGEELIERLERKSREEDGPRMFVAVIPQLDRSGAAAREARIRLAAMLERLDASGVLSAGMIGDPDPYTSVMNALELFKVDDIVISTLPGERSGWLRSDLIERVQGATSVPVEHVVVDVQSPNAASAA